MAEDDLFRLGQFFGGDALLAKFGYDLQNQLFGREAIFRFDGGFNS